MNLRQEMEHLTPALRRLARLLVAGTADTSVDMADDLVHETLLRALRFNEPVKGVSIRYWLCALLIGINRQQARGAVTREAHDTGPAQGLQHRQNFQARGEFQRAGEQRARPAGTAGKPAGADHGFSVAALTMEEREVLALVVLEGMSYSDAAALLGLPRATLVARLARARASLGQQSQPQASRFVPERAHLRLVQ